MPEYTHFIGLVKVPPPSGVIFAYSGVFMPPFEYQYWSEGGSLKMCFESPVFLAKVKHLSTLEFSPSLHLPPLFSISFILHLLQPHFYLSSLFLLSQRVPFRSLWTKAHIPSSPHFHFFSNEVILIKPHHKRWTLIFEGCISSVQEYM